MMKILTQKMVRAQGLEAGMSGFCHFPFLVIPSAARNLLSGGAGKQQVPRRFRSSE
jgi:hypothetical protein